jgi:DNA gyrase/topoisomerase IV subunit A
LEESFCGDSNNNENQKIIKEQNELIETMKKEMNDLRNKYNYSEMRLKDLDEIKKEFADLSGALLKPKSDNSSQTEIDTAFNSGSSFISNYSND